LINIFVHDKTLAEKISEKHGKYKKDDILEETIYCFYNIPRSVEDLKMDYGEQEIELRDSITGKILYHNP